MLPPTDFDVCAYHLQAPKEFLQQGRVSFLPHSVFANMPLGSEMLSMLAMLCMDDWWWGALAGKTVLAAFTPLCALAIFAAGRRCYSAPAGAIAALVYISTPWVVSVSSAGLVEGVLACYTFLAIFAFMLFNTQRATEDCKETRANGSAGLLALSGYLVGGAVATKYPALLFLLIPLGVAIVAVGFAKSRPIVSEATLPTGRLSRLLQTTAKRLAVFLLAVGFGCGLWLGKNWAMTGNPTYPLLYEVFGGTTWSDAKDRHWNEVHRPHNFSIASLGECVERVVLTSEWISLLAAPLAAMTLFRKRIRGFVWALLLYVGFVIVVWWLFAPRVDRFWMPMTPALVLLAGMGAYWSCERWWRMTLAGLLLLGLATSFLVVASDRENAWFLPLDQLRSDPNWINPWHWYLNKKAVDSDAVLVVGTPAVFHLKSRVYYNTCFDDCILEQLVKNKTPEEIRRAVAAKGIAYVLVDWDAIARYRSTYGFTDFVQPEVFNRLVRQGILTPLPPMRRIDQRLYHVSPSSASERKGG
jgi:4-amino-4-deoxy-L-arabinose transferase-like glycosyltransferase